MGFWPVGCFAASQVLVVGGTSGIGAAIASAFLSEGASVTVTGATPAEVQSFAESQPAIRALALDVRDGPAVQSHFAQCAALDHLIYCAGIIRRGAEHDPAIFSEVLDVNLTGAMRAAAAARPLLAASQGTITTIASVLSFHGGGLVPGYAASKGGIVQMTKSLAIAYAPDRIRVNAIAPGWVKTGFTTALREDPARSAAILARTPLGRWAEPEDIAGGAIYLASPIAAFVTGSTLVIDGGYTVY